MNSANAFLYMVCCTSCSDYNNYSQQRISSYGPPLGGLTPLTME